MPSLQCYHRTPITLLLFGFVEISIATIMKSSNIAVDVCAKQICTTWGEYSF